jgi:hypothetical protein
MAFNPNEPDLHRSFAFAQAQDWAAVSDAVMREPNWQSHAPLCLRLTESALNRRRRVEALAAWCHVCWRAPAMAADGARKLRHPELSSLWQRFLDEEQPLTEVDFPAWLLLREPGLVLQLAEDLAPGNTAPEAHYRTVHRLIQARRARRHGDELSLRKSLQESNPALLNLLKQSI